MIQIKITTKFIIVGMAMITILALLYSFTNNTDNKTNLPRTIEVIGSAEMSLKPDKIKLRIQLAYNNNTKKEKEDKLFKVLKKHGIKENQVEYANFNGYNGWYSNWYRYYYEYWYYSTYYHTYDIPIDSKIDPKKLLQDLKKPDINNLWIQNDGFENITEERKKVKIAAIQAAKEKANYLLNAVNEKLGYVISIQEMDATPEARHFNPYWGYSYGSPSNLSSSTSNAVVNSNQNQENTVKGAATDKLKYEVKVVFSIQ